MINKDAPFDICDKDKLYDLGAYIYWQGGDSTVTLDGEFTIEQLEFIVQHVKQYQSETSEV